MAINSDEILQTMEWLDAYYRRPDGLGRAEGLSRRGSPDFEAIAAWVCDVFTNSRLSGLSVEQSRANVIDGIQVVTGNRLSGNHLPPYPYQRLVTVGRDEFMKTLHRLDVFYRSWNGLQRANGFSRDGQPDFEAIAVWIFGTYLNSRDSGRSPEQAWAQLVEQIKKTDEWRSKAREPMDASTLVGKHLMGYQGWFYRPDDGQNNGWDHWFPAGGEPTAENAGFDFWPDTRELFDSELTATAMTMRDGSPARLFSAHDERTLQRHFEWMADYAIDGVSIGRFLDGTRSDGTRQRLDGQLLKMRKAAEATGRVFFVWYDVTGCSEASFLDVLKRDWTHIVETLRLTQSSRYLKHNGKPLVGLWAAGANTCPQQPRAWIEMTEWLKRQPGSGSTVLLSSIRDWRTNDEWRPVLEAGDVIAPWTANAFTDDAAADRYRRDTVEPDVAHAKARKQLYMPIIFPGFSWHNLKRAVEKVQAEPNAGPRRGGRFYWRQAFNVINAGAPCLFTAMFDEVDEGTACFKIAETQADVPREGFFLSLDTDGEALPSDWYLRLAGQAGKMLRREIPIQDTIPIRP